MSKNVLQKSKLWHIALLMNQRSQINWNPYYRLTKLSPLFRYKIENILCHIFLSSYGRFVSFSSLVADRRFKIQNMNCFELWNGDQLTVWMIYDKISLLKQSCSLWVKIQRQVWKLFVIWDNRCACEAIE